MGIYCRFNPGIKVLMLTGNEIKCTCLHLEETMDALFRTIFRFYPRIGVNREY